jgi:hypothetical protein
MTTTTAMTSMDVIQRAKRAYTVCHGCGIKHGRGIIVKGEQKPCRESSTFHRGKCDICRRFRDITEFRDYGYSRYDSGIYEGQP